MAQRTTARPTPIDRAWLNERVIAAGFASVSALAERMGISRSMMSRKLNGHFRLQIAEARRMASLLNVSVGALLEHAGGARREAASTVTVPLVGLVDGAGVVRASWDQVRGDQVAGPVSLPAGAAALMVEDGINQGALIYLGPESTEVDRAGYAVVRVGDDELACYFRPKARGVTILAWPGMSGVRRRAAARVAWVRPVLWVQMA